MGLSRNQPDDDELVQCALRLDIVSHVLCQYSKWTEQDIRRWQNYFFQFGLLMSRTFRVDVSTKLHRFMRHVDTHLVHLGCIRRGSSEENEMVHKEFKALYNFTIKHIATIASQILTNWVHCDQKFDDNTDVDHSVSSDGLSSSDFEEHPSFTPSSFPSDNIITNTIRLVSELSGTIPHTDTPSYIATVVHNGVQVWRKVKRLPFHPSVPNYENLLHKSAFARSVVHGRRNRQDAVLYTSDSASQVGIIDSIFCLSVASPPYSQTFALILRLHEVQTDSSNCAVVHQYGHGRCRYTIAPDGHIYVQFMQSLSILQPIALVVDPYWLTETYGVQKN